MGFLGKLGGICPISPTRNARLRAKKASDTVENFFIVVGDVSRDDRQQVRLELFRLQGRVFNVAMQRIDAARMIHFSDQIHGLLDKRERLIQLYEQVCTLRDKYQKKDLAKAQFISLRDFESYEKTGDSPEITKLDKTIKQLFSELVKGLDAERIMAIVFECGCDESELFDYCYASVTRIEDCCAPTYIFKSKLR